MTLSAHKVVCVKKEGGGAFLNKHNVINNNASYLSVLGKVRGGSCAKDSSGGMYGVLERGGGREKRKGLLKMNCKPLCAWITQKTKEMSVE